MCLLVCWFVGLSAFYRPHDICPLCGAASEYSESSQAVAGGPARSAQASMHMHSESTRAHAVQLHNEKIAALMPFKNKTVRARACCRIRNCRDSQKKGKRKPTCHFPSSVHSLPSLGVFTLRIVLNRILHKSSLLAPMESRRTRRPTFTAEERLERRREQDRRRHAERRARKDGSRHRCGHRCGSPAVFPSPCLGDSSTKTTIMTVHVNKIMQAAPSQRRIILISEASNQLLFRSQTFFVE